MRHKLTLAGYIWDSHPLTAGLPTDAAGTRLHPIVLLQF
jgi:hypothetical protein